jgi:hypothetical protein
MCGREDYQALLASIDQMPLNVNEVAVAFENSGRSIHQFPVTLHYARRQRLVRNDRSGRIALTARGKKVLDKYRS